MSLTEFWQAIGYKLLNAPEVTAIAGSRISHGRIPEVDEDDPELPVINYFEISNPNVRDGAVEAPFYQISCRARDPEVAQLLAQAVVQAFHGEQQSVNGFDIQDAHFQNKQLISEPDERMYHVPVEVRFIGG